MTDHPPHKLSSDIGGEEAGAIDTHDHGMKFWEKQANGLRSVLQRKGYIKTDELRRAAEELPNYSELEYFEKTTGARRTIALERGFFTEEELRKKVEEVRARFNVPSELDSPVKKAAPKK